MTVLGLMVLRTLNKKKWEIFSHFFLFSTFILPQNITTKWAFFQEWSFLSKSCIKYIEVILWNKI